jgi:hypothetical protein
MRYYWRWIMNKQERIDGFLKGLSDLSNRYNIGISNYWDGAGHWAVTLDVGEANKAVEILYVLNEDGELEVILKEEKYKNG